MSVIRPTTLREALHEAAEALAEAGCATPGLDAGLLFAYVLELEPWELASTPDRIVPDAALDHVRQLLRRRALREPLAYITGFCVFRGLRLEVDRRVHLPRGDWEGMLVDVAIQLRKSARVHDVGTGSGAIALAIKQERPDLRVSGSDISQDAIEVARSNAALLGLAVDFEVASYLAAGEFDLVVADLPYGPDDVLETALEPEAHRHQPRIAFSGGHDGLDHVRGLIRRAPAGCVIAIEHDPSQAEAVRCMLHSAETHLDPAGHERVTVGATPVSATAGSGSSA